LRAILEKDSNNAEACFLMSQVAERVGRPVPACEFAARAYRVDSSQFRYCLQYSRCLMLINQSHQALEILDSTSVPSNAGAETLDAIATIMSRCGATRAAVDLYRRAISKDPGNSRIHYNLAATQRMLGELDEAQDSCQRAIALDQTDVEAWFLLSELKQWSQTDNRIAKLDGLLQEGDLKPGDESLLRYAIGKQHEDCGNFDEAFEYIASAAALRRRSLRYDVSSDVAVLENISEVHTRKCIAATSPGLEGSNPVFVVGLPRSGTTLVERILASHPLIESKGELNNFAEQLTVQCHQQMTTSDKDKMSLVLSSLELDMEELGRAYMDSVRRPDDEDSLRFVDKMPSNYLYCGLIKAALPDAKVILLRRHPLDSCFAMYRMPFTTAYPFSYDLNDLADYFIAWDKLMKHWQGVLGDALLIVHYESLVTSPKAVSRAIIEHVGEDWHPACLDFHQLDAPSATASATQVRQPIYQSSVGKWRYFEKQLEPLSSRLAATGINFE